MSKRYEKEVESLSEVEIVNEVEPSRCMMSTLMGLEIQIAKKSDPMKRPQTLLP